MIAGLLAYGYDIANHDVEEARTLLLSAAHAEGRLSTASAQGSLDDVDARDPQYQLALLDLRLEPVGDGQEQRFVLASYFQRTEDEPIAVIDEPPTGVEPDVLAWAKKVLDVGTDDEPQWMLCWSSLA